jgi:hypothetical protein
LDIKLLPSLSLLRPLSVHTSARQAAPSQPPLLCPPPLPASNSSAASPPPAAHLPDARVVAAACAWPRKNIGHDWAHAGAVDRPPSSPAGSPSSSTSPCFTATTGRAMTPAEAWQMCREGGRTANGRGAWRPHLPSRISQAAHAASHRRLRRAPALARPGCRGADGGLPSHFQLLLPQVQGQTVQQHSREDPPLFRSR